MRLVKSDVGSIETASWWALDLGLHCVVDRTFCQICLQSLVAGPCQRQLLGSVSSVCSIHGVLVAALTSKVLSVGCQGICGIVLLRADVRPVDDVCGS